MGINASGSAANCSGERSLGVLRLRLADGRVLTRQLIRLDAEGRLLSYEDIQAEQPFCEWFRGEWREDASAQ